MGSTTSLGNRLERQAIRILEGLGYTLASQAKRRPIWKKGVVVGNDGNIDLVKGAFDIIAVKRGFPTVFLQVTTVSAMAGHRPKLRGVTQLSLPHHLAVAFAWDDGPGNYRVYRAEEDWLDKGHRIEAGAKCWPWEVQYKQATL